ncbi:MAG: GDSL-type esterase/lipase family protein [Xenococcaceae cyanobacterium MO_188.B29]|nr:GDSL-type esterase/lipase family protein [Xenococcaceae cyanobacterium MO_188.B29]
MKLINQYGLLIIVSFLLLVSLLANFSLYKELKLVYLSLYATSLNPLSIQRYSPDKIPKITTENSPKVVFFGDSRAVGWSKPELTEFQFINRGVGGQTSAQVLGRFDQHVAILNPDIIVVQVGINDLRMLPRSPNTREDIVKNCQENIAQIVQKAQEIGAKVILTTIFPLGEGNIPLKQRLFWPSINQMKQDINSVNNYIKTLESDVVILDAYNLLKSHEANYSNYYRDLLHLNGRGYEFLNQQLSKLLAEL